MSDEGAEIENPEEVAEQEEIKDALESQDPEDFARLVAGKSGYYQEKAITQTKLGVRMKAQEYGVRSGDLSKVTMPGYIDFNLRSAIREANNPRSSERSRFEAKEKMRKFEGAKKAYERGQTDLVQGFLREEQQAALKGVSTEVRAMKHPTHFGRPERTTENMAINAIDHGVDYMVASRLLETASPQAARK